MHHSEQVNGIVFRQDIDESLVWYCWGEVLGKESVDSIGDGLQKTLWAFK